MFMKSCFVVASILLAVFVVCSQNHEKSEEVDVSQNEQIVESPSSDYQKIQKEKDDLSTNTIIIEVNNTELIVELEDNIATKELVQKLDSGSIVVNALEYGGFEKVGSLGFSLTKDDHQITTEAGDIVLYQGNHISLFYNSNSWSYTKLGKVTNMSKEELKQVLGSDDVTMLLKVN